MKNRLEVLAKQVYNEYNSGSLDGFLPEEELSLIEMYAGGKGADYFALRRLQCLAPDLDFQHLSYLIVGSGPTDFQSDRRTVPVLFDGETEWIVDPFIVDIVPGIEDRAYSSRDAYPIVFKETK